MADIDFGGAKTPSDSAVWLDPKPYLTPVIRYNRSRRIAGYWPCLIKYVGEVGTNLRFHGVEVKGSNHEFGPNGTDAANDYYTVDRVDLNHVYREAPSTIERIGATDCYAILLLSDKFLQDKVLLLDRARGGPKWPAGAGGIKLLESELEQLRERLTLRDDLLASLPDALDFTPEQRARLHALSLNLLK